MKRLNTRERYAIMLASGFIGLFIVMQFLVFPLLDKKRGWLAAFREKNPG